MEKYIVAVFFILLTSCDLFVEEQKDPQNITPRDVSVNEVEDEPIRKKIAIKKYDGKYSLKNRFWNLQKIKDVVKDIEKTLAERIGFLQDQSLHLEIEYVDWQQEYKQIPYSILPQTTNGKTTWRIVYVSEHLQNGSIPLNIIYRISIADVLLRSSTSDHYEQIPDFFWKSALFYACDFSEYLLKKSLLEMVNAKSISLETVVVGLNSNEKKFPELEAFFALLFLKERFREETVKKFLYNVLLENKDWEREIVSTSGDDLGTFAKKVTLFAQQYLVSKYRNVVAKYNEALKEYLTENFGTAIAKGQTFNLNYYDNFLSRDMYFWMAMCYYELKNYAACNEQLQNVFSEKRYYCYHLPLAHYRRAMTLYRSQKLSLAVDAFANFRRDFPWETDFAGSSLFFQGESFLANNQYERAIFHFEEFMKNHPQHSRHSAVVEKMAYLYLKVHRYKRAKDLFVELQQLDVDEKIKLLAKKSHQDILGLEATTPPPSLQRELDEMVLRFPSLTTGQKQQIFYDISLIGKIAFPWLKKLPREGVKESFIKCISDIADPKGISILLDLLKNEQKYEKEVILALAKIGIPATELEMVLTKEYENLPRARRDKILQEFSQLFWGASVDITQKIPSFIEEINGDANQQYNMIEKMNLLLGKEQVPILEKLVLQGKSEKVKIHALENIMLWQDTSTRLLLNKLLLHQNETIRYLAIKGFAKQKHYEIENFEKLFKDSSSKVREEALNLLPFVAFSSKIKVLVDLLDDKDYNIRNRARQSLLDSKDKSVNFVLANGLIKDSPNINYYNYIIQILRIRTNNFELLKSYHPQLSSSQRKQLAKELVETWK